MLKLAEVIRQILWPGLETAALVALVLLVLLGGGICWIHQPDNRIDAFARGFSVFALLAVATPYQIPPQGLADPAPVEADNPVSAPSASWENPQHPGFRLTVAGGLSDAWGAYVAYDERPTAAQQALSKTTLRFQPAASKGGAIPDLMVTLRDANTAEVVAYENVSTGTVVIRKPPGRYVIEAEAPGYKRASFRLQLGEAPTEYIVRLEPSTVPLSLQRTRARQTRNAPAAPPPLRNAVSRFSTTGPPLCAVLAAHRGCIAPAPSG